jgi:hypothetical protein
MLLILVQTFCRALGEYHAASFVFTRFLGFLDDARNDNDLRLKSSTEHLISDAHGPRLFLPNVRDSEFDEVEQGRTGFNGSTTIWEGDVYRVAGLAS